MGVDSRHGRGMVGGGGVDALVGWGCSPHLPFAFRVRWVCAMLATSSRRSRLAFDGGVLWHPPPHTSFAFRDRWEWLWPPPPPPVGRVSRSMGVCCVSHHLHPSFASGVRWVCALARRLCLAMDGGVLCWPPPPTVVRVSRSMGVCYVSHLLPSFAFRDRWGVLWHVGVSQSTGVCYASHHLHPSFASGVRWVCALARRSCLAIDGDVPC